MDQNKFALAFVSLLYCGAMEGQPALLSLWVLAGTPLTLSAETLASSAPVLVGSLAPVLVGSLVPVLGKLVSLVSAFVWGLVAGAVTSQACHPVSTEAPSEEANHDPQGCQFYTRIQTQHPSTSCE